jgi:hypothetical protein
MEPESHFDLKVSKSFLDSIYMSVPVELLRPINVRIYLNEGENGHVRHLMSNKSVLCADLVPLHVSINIIFMELPCKKESISNIFVHCSAIVINGLMNYFSNLVYENEDIFL